MSAVELQCCNWHIRFVMCQPQCVTGRATIVVLMSFYRPPSLKVIGNSQFRCFETSDVPNMPFWSPTCHFRAKKSENEKWPWGSHHISETTSHHQDPSNKLEFMEIGPVVSEIRIPQSPRPLISDNVWPMGSPFMGEWAYKHASAQLDIQTLQINLSWWKLAR